MLDSHDAERIARLEYQVGQLYRHLGLNPDQGAAPFDAPSFGAAPVPAFGAPAQPAFGSAPPPAAARSFPPQFDEALRRGKMIEAIKIYREVTGLGLKEAKNAVETIVRNGGVH